MKERDKFELAALEIAKPHLQKEDVNIVHVNQNALYWLNNEAEQMDAYFTAKKEKYWTFTKADIESVVPVNEQIEGEDETTKKGRKPKK